MAQALAAMPVGLSMIKGEAQPPQDALRLPQAVGCTDSERDGKREEEGKEKDKTDVFFQILSGPQILKIQLPYSTEL